MAKNEPGWVKVATTDDLEPDTAYESDIEIDDQAVGVFAIDGQYYALGSCTHEQGPLCQGVIENGTVTCPWHSAVFDIRTGICLSGPTACRVDGSVVDTDVAEDLLQPCTTYEVKVENGDIFVRPRVPAEIGALES